MVKSSLCRRSCCPLIDIPVVVVSYLKLLYVTVPGKRVLVAHLKKIELLQPLGRVGFELQNALHI